MATGDLYRLAFNINCDGEETTCVLGYLQTAGANDANTLELTCQDFIDDKVPLLLDWLSSSATVTRVKMDTVTDHQEVPGLIDMNGFVGDVVVLPLPAQMSCLIHFLSTAPNAKHNGRIYIAGLPFDDQNKGEISVAPLAVIQLFADELLVNLVPGGGQTAIFTPVVISRFEDGIKRVPPLGFTLLSVTAKKDMRQQRRRKTPHFGLA